jgi:hypothetical protein
MSNPISAKRLLKRLTEKITGPPTDDKLPLLPFSPMQKPNPKDRSPRAEEMLTAEHIAEFKEVFTAFDADGSGAIDASELKVVLKQFGQDLTTAEVNLIIEEVDDDNDGEIDWEEFLAMMTLYAGKAAGSAALSAPDGPGVQTKLASSVADAKLAVLGRVENILLGEVRENSARAIRSETGKSFFEEQLVLGVVSVLQELSASFDQLQGRVVHIIDQKDQKQSAVVTATRAQCFMEAVSAVVDAKKAARLQQAQTEERLALQAEETVQAMKRGTQTLSIKITKYKSSLRAMHEQHEQSLHTVAQLEAAALEAKGEIAGLHVRLAEVEASAQSKLEQLAARKAQDIDRLRGAYAAEQDASDTYDMLASSASPAQLLADRVAMGRKYEVAMEELAMLRRDRAALRLERQGGKRSSALYTSRMERECDALRQTVTALMERLTQHENPALSPKKERGAGGDTAADMAAAQQAKEAEEARAAASAAEAAARAAAAEAVADGLKKKIAAAMEAEDFPAIGRLTNALKKLRAQTQLSEAKQSAAQPASPTKPRGRRAGGGAGAGGPRGSLAARAAGVET